MIKLSETFGKNTNSGIVVKQLR